jgi:hypothetical protein
VAISDFMALSWVSCECFEVMVSEVVLAGEMGTTLVFADVSIAETCEEFTIKYLLKIEDTRSTRLGQSSRGDARLSSRRELWIEKASFFQQLKDLLIR